MEKIIAYLLYKNIITVSRHSYININGRAMLIHVDKLKHILSDNIVAEDHVVREKITLYKNLFKHYEPYIQ